MFNQENINELMQAQLSSDEIKEYVNEKVKATIKNAIDDQFSAYGRGSSDAKNKGYLKINEAIQSAIGLNLDKIKLPEFQALYIDEINSALNKIAQHDMSLMMQKNMEKLLITDRKYITLQELLYEYMDDENILNRYEELSDLECSCYPQEISADDIDISILLEDEDIIGLLLQKDDNGKYLEICFQNKGNEEYTFQYETGLRVRKIDDADSDLYETWSFCSNKIGNEGTNIITTEFSNFERLLFQITKGVTKIKITNEELDNLFDKK